MINFRDTFNLKYGYIILIFAIFLFLIMFIIHKNIKDSFRLVGKILISVGIINIIMVGIIWLICNIFIGYNYRLFINVVLDTLYSNLLYKSIISIIIGFVLIIIYRYGLINTRVENVK